MEGKKISQLTPDTSPSTDDFIVSVDGATMENKRVDFGSLPVSNPTRSYVDNRTPIYGLGFPNGVISATPGRIYIDENVTNGASSWIKKSGTGNTGWQVLEGDTGWRAVGGSVLNGWSSSDIGLKIRRLNGTVYLEAGSGGPTGAAKTAQIFYTAPAGFNPFTSPQYAVVAAASESGVTALKRVLRNNNSFECDSITSILFSAAYPTNDTWPTTLPGTPA